MKDFIETLYKWQEIAGAVIGGIFALWVALLVAYDARHRLEKSSAMVVISVLLSFRASYIGVRDKINEEAAGKSEDDKTIALSLMVATFSPKIPEHFGQAVAVLMPLNFHLAAHLSHVELFQSNLFQAIPRLQRDQEEAAREPHKKELPRPKGDILVDARIVRRAMVDIFNSSGCAVILINRLVLSRWRMFNNLRMWLCPDELENKCADALESGYFDLPMADS